MPSPEQSTTQRQQYRKPYAESSVFIAWIEGEVRGGVDRGLIGAYVLRMAERGAFKVYTATWTMAEVHKKRSTPTLALSAEHDAKILSFRFFRFIAIIEK